MKKKMTTEFSDKGIKALKPKEHTYDVREKSGITAIYDRHSYDIEKRNTLERWGEKLRQIINPEQHIDNIINLSQAIKQNYF